MVRSITVTLFAIAAFLFHGGVASAGESEEFLIAVEDSLAHYREATSYLRTGNIDLAAIELENMADTWRAISERFGATPPDAFDGNAAYGPTLAETARTIEAALAAIDADRPDV